MKQHTIIYDSMNTKWNQKIQRRGIRILIGFLVLVNCLVGKPVKAVELIYSLDQLGCAECNEYQLDFLYLVKILEESHPNVYVNFPKEEFEQEKEHILKELETLNDLDAYALRLQQFCARIGDAHTKIDYDKVMQGNSQRIFSVGFTVLHDDFYLTDFDTAVDMKCLGAKVLAVNGIPMAQVIQQLGRLASCENDICRKQEVREFLQEPHTLQSMGIIGDNERLTLSVTTRDGAEQRLTRPRRARRAVEWAAINIKDHPVTAKKGAGFFYRMLPEHHLCYFQFNKFRDRQVLKRRKRMMGVEQFNRLYDVDPETFVDFRDFLQMMFDEIHQKQITYLVIDLRYNGGGSSILGTQIMYYFHHFPEVLKGYVMGIKLSALLRHQKPGAFEAYKRMYAYFSGKNTLTLPLYLERVPGDTEDCSVKTRDISQKTFFEDIERPESFFYIAPPTVRFSGKVFLLIGPGTFSSASDFATTMRDNQLATLIGQPISQKPNSFGDKLFFQLPHTKIEGSVSYKMFYRPDATKDDDPTLYPDIEVWPTIDDIVNGRDPVFDKVLELIEQDRGQ